jgi:hypothetical protein
MLVALVAALVVAMSTIAPVSGQEGQGQAAHKKQRPDRCTKPGCSRSFDAPVRRKGDFR